MRREMIYNDLVSEDSVSIQEVRMDPFNPTRPVKLEKPVATPETKIAETEIRRNPAGSAEPQLGAEALQKNLDKQYEENLNEVLEGSDHPATLGRKLQEIKSNSEFDPGGLDKIDKEVRTKAFATARKNVASSLTTDRELQLLKDATLRQYNHLVDGFKNGPKPGTERMYRDHRNFMLTCIQDLGGYLLEITGDNTGYRSGGVSGFSEELRQNEDLRKLAKSLKDKVPLSSVSHNYNQKTAALKSFEKVEDLLNS